MARSSFNPSPSSSDECYIATPTQDDVSSDDPSAEETRGLGEAQIRGLGSIGSGTLEENFRTLGGFHFLGGVQTRGGGARTRGAGFQPRRGGARIRGGFPMQGIRAPRRRRNDLTRSAFGIPSTFGFTSIEDGNLSDNSFVPCAEEEEAAEEEGIGAQVQEGG